MTAWIRIRAKYQQYMLHVWQMTAWIKAKYQQYTPHVVNDRLEYG
jgi:hypothetical protein